MKEYFMIEEKFVILKPDSKKSQAGSACKQSRVFPDLIFDPLSQHNATKISLNKEIDKH